MNKLEQNIFIDELLNEYFMFVDEYDEMVENDHNIMTSPRLALVNKQMIKLRCELRKLDINV